MFTYTFTDSPSARPSSPKTSPKTVFTPQPHEQALADLAQAMATRKGIRLAKAKLRASLALEANLGLRPLTQTIRKGNH